MKPTMPKYCRTEREDKLLVVTLDRPDVLNSLHAPACLELDEVFNDFERDPALWIAVITGAGDRAFCAGHDLADAPDAPMPPSGWAGLAERPDRTKPLIAAVNGLALGGGFEIALACDIILASETASFGLPEPLVGAVALGGGVHRLVRQIGVKPAMGMILASRRVSAAEGQALGFVNEIAPPDQLP